MLWAPNRAPAWGRLQRDPQRAPPAPRRLQDPREIEQLQFFSPWGEPPAAPSTAASAPWDTPAPGSRQLLHSTIPRLGSLRRPAIPAPSSRIPCGGLAWEPPMSPPDPVQVLLPAAPPCAALHGGSDSHSGDSHCAGGSHSFGGSGGDGGSRGGSDIAPVMRYQLEGKAQKQLHQP